MHQCSLKVILGISVFFLNICDNISAFQTETDRGFMVIIIVIRVFLSLFYHC